MSTDRDNTPDIPSYGPAWDAAIEHGIDVTLLMANLELTPAQRIARLDQLNRFAAEVQRRTVPAKVREAMARKRLQEKLEALGPEK